MLHIISQDAETVGQPAIFDRAVLELLDEPGESHGLLRDHIPVDLLDVPGGVPVGHDVLDEFDEVRGCHDHAVQGGLLPLAVRVLGEQDAHVRSPRVDVVPDIVNYLVHLSLVVHVFDLDLCLVKEVLAPYHHALEA